MHPRNISIRAYDYPLPPDLIADQPMAERDQSRLLIYRNGNIATDIYRNLASHLSADALLIFNDTRVLPARLLFQKPSGGMIEIFLLEPSGGIAAEEALQQHGSTEWNCLVGGASKWKPGYQPQQHLESPRGRVVLAATLTDRSRDAFRIRFDWTPDGLPFSDLLKLAGNMPLPPYIRRPPVAADTERYQTVYARAEGSVAAPTAGLHFTDHVLSSLMEKGIQKNFVTLHVGAGTFRPVKSERMEGHDMHEEFIRVQKSVINQLIHHSGPVHAVGTTSMRTLESLYWLGLKTWRKPDLGKEELVIDQWAPYEEDAADQPSVGSALQSLVDWMEARDMDSLYGHTRLIIAPGYRFRVVDGLITNFHQPQSTLLLLVAALIGEDWKVVYDYAITAGFRFLSYGDGCLFDTRRKK